MEPMTTKRSKAPKQVALYTRVSTDHQTTENQERELREIADRMGWTIAMVYTDAGISGAKSRADRPAARRGCRRNDRRLAAILSPPPSRDGPAHGRRAVRAGRCPTGDYS